uniref:Uncharacterized protein n=1 Tax=Salmonella phage PMBT35 TaxID=3137287 RepID=A0AAU8BWE1_9VIRU
MFAEIARIAKSGSGRFVIVSLVKISNHAEEKENA